MLELWNKLDFEEKKNGEYIPCWTFWRRNFFLILAHPVYKMLLIEEPNILELWNKLHFEEKKLRVYTVFKIFSNYICWINILNATFRG